MNKTLILSLGSLALNLLFSVYYLAVSVWSDSWWLFTLGVYYLILSVIRFFVIRAEKSQRFLTRFTGIMLIALSISLFGTVILSVVQDRGREFHMIIMIAIAAYSFTKITLATVNLFKARRSSSARLITLRNVSFADAVVSIFALQRSMLVTFDGMSDGEIRHMNALLGAAVCVTVFLLGLNLLKSRRILFKALNAPRDDGLS